MASGGLSLQEAIEQAASEIAEKLPAGTRIAIIDFESESPQLSDYIREELTGALVNSKLEVADRVNLERLRKELNLQLSGEVDDASAQSIGKFLGVQTVVTGQFINTGSRYRFRANSIAVETAKRETATRLDVAASRDLRELIAALNRHTATPRAEERTEQTAKAAEPAKPAEAPKPAEPAKPAEAPKPKETPKPAEAPKPKETAPAKSTPPADESNKRGIRFLDSGNYDSAITAFSDAIKSDPKFAAAYNNRGLAYSFKGNNDRAIADYTQAIKLDPYFALAYGNRGVSYQNIGQTRLAIQDYETALDYDPYLGWVAERLDALTGAW
jgi:tetratricopeptide (TPR) repeat protein